MFTKRSSSLPVLVLVAVLALSAVPMAGVASPDGPGSRHQVAVHYTDPNCTGTCQPVYHPLYYYLFRAFVEKVAHLFHVNPSVQ